MIRDLTDAEARAALPCKWGAVPEGTVPAWVAEMDLAPPEPVTDAVAEAVRRGVAGYAPFGDGGIGAALAGFASRHWGWEVPPDAAVPTADVVSGIRLALEVLCPPGPVVVPLPCYPPFREVVALSGREPVWVRTDPDSPDAALDLAAVERALDAGARTVLLCNPHNPLGRVPRRGELEGLRDLAARYGARVVSDEIHGPLTLPGATFTPYLSVDPEGIAVTSVSKSFNTAGLHCAAVVALEADDRSRLWSVPTSQNHGYSPLGMIAATVAWTECDDWLASLVARLDDQRAVLSELLAEHLPLARTRPLEATYLAWLDLRAHGVDDPAAAALGHGVRLASGQLYEPGLAGHLRLNLATTPERLGLAVTRLAAALSP
ncbi:MalY/PatB family protein [Nocardioides donggukensis]|uniref:cysteine-S-conjugate beta-lyase n=1 Tax=Nocardioides donggukensis TaxID=2774019 RepID=A0A927K3M7_9ACTN|nr:aminotransferase class I/II-fold pyridoxal phosphate-dependent enzyme [Nocardioides donggukensis]MBD8869539.1 aminotransferase class I/II-fold pyridoxal phosphate-dependent enzyme [Nocardioides donggukensis]